LTKLGVHVVLNPTALIAQQLENWPESA